MIDLAALVLTCAPLVAQDTAHALIQVESAGHPFAIGVVGGALVRQPATLAEAVATAAALDAAGWNYSVGLGQINKRNFQRFGLTPATAFAPCANLAALQGILSECFSRARQRAPPQAALRDAFSCYYSGNFATGRQHGYVGKVLAAWSSRAQRATAGPVLSHDNLAQARFTPRSRSPTQEPRHEPR
ncbi:MAG: lytic transglycosylase domain-containing protein [Bacteriovorax sp.]|nr:lytic transglycosylase domain-containing protein [Rhizobacter sp.]